MLALKDIDGVGPVLGNTAIATSPLWNAPVDKISPYQLTAFRARLSIDGMKAQADAMIDFALQRVARLDTAATLKMLDYVEPDDAVMTTTELVRGFEQMQRPKPAAILFGLEMGMSAEDVVSLTWPVAKQHASRGRLTDYARHILCSQPISISSRYVFWQQSGKKAMPLFGLESEVFDVFGRVWAELQAGYRNLVIVPEWSDLSTDRACG